MTDKIRMGIIGPGVIAPSHAFAIDKAQGARLAAVCGRRLEPTAELADQYGAESVTDIAALLDHIDYITDRFGVDHLAIGTDSPYVSTEATSQKVSPGRPARTRWEALWPQNDPLFAAEWKEERQTRSLAWTNWPLFTVGLVQRGYGDEEIRKIIGGNFLRVAQEVWPH